MRALFGRWTIFATRVFQLNSCVDHMRAVRGEKQGVVGFVLLWAAGLEKNLG
jgi:hypothetical protein